MNRFLVVPLAVFAALALPGAAGAVTIQEFPIEPGAAPGVHAPYYVKTGPDGNLWIVDRGTSAGIQRMSMSGQRLPPIATLGPPQDIAVGASGAVFWTETAVDGDPVGGKLALRLPDGSISRTGPKERANPYSVALSSDEDVWMGSQIANAASPDNGLARLCVLADDFTMPCRSDVTGAKTRYTGIAVAPGNVGWVAAFEANVVKRFRPPPPPAIIPDADLNVTLPAGSGPGRIALGPDGNLWVTMYTGNAIDRITPAGERVRFPLPPGARGPNDIAAGPDGAMWFTEFDGNAIGRITMSGQITEFPVPTIASRPYGITTGPDGNIWFTENVG
ncbi:MAG: virginiamycin lyase, partial [Solirubrobacteraceae bacterium]|nr:virginiamycin lyase [Solirubrobacteraceae bacterium]